MSVSGRQDSARRISKYGGGVALLRGTVVALMVLGAVALATSSLDAPLRWSLVGGLVAGGLSYFAMPWLARTYLSVRLPIWIPRSAPPLGALDVALWTVSLWFADEIAHNLGATEREFPSFWAAVLVVCVVQAIVGGVIGIYRGRWQVGSFGEAIGVVCTASVTLAVFDLVVRTTGINSPPAAARLVAALLAATTMLIPRAVWRFTQQRRSQTIDTVRILVLGAGRGAAAIIPSLLDPGSGLLPVGIIDDAPSKKFRTLHGVRVLGTRERMQEIATRLKVEAVLIAIPSAEADLVREFVGEIEACDLKALIMPRPAALLGVPGAGDVREVTEADLLGRRMFDTDLAAISSYVTGRRVLVTGAGGSIGSELARQLYLLNPAELVLLDRDESALHGTILSMTGRALLSDDSTVLCDIRDARAVQQVFDERRPEVVFHAAALKHVPMLERFPDEAYKTNVLGTHNVLVASEVFGVERFVNISTDKAADPVNILGLSKRVTERLTATFGMRLGKPYLSVRFGNVLGSRGSMLITFRGQVEQGGPITVTHPEATRYFMMIEEAVALTIQAGAIGACGEVLVLDMGEPVRINDVAELLIARSKRPIRIEYTGLRPGEKLHEVLFSEHEHQERRDHPAISHALVPPVPEAELRQLYDIERPRWNSEVEMTRLALGGFEAADAPTPAASDPANRLLQES